MQVNISIAAKSRDKFTDNILRVGCKADHCTFGALALQQLGNDVCVWDSSHGGKSIVLCFAPVDLGSICFDGQFCPF